jgi:dolichol-phosphate mannosyltransferase
MVETVVIIPTYNEADNLDDLLLQLLALPVSLGVIVVDDNSPDGTGKLADKWAAQQPEHISKGPGVRGKADYDDGC